MLDKKYRASKVGRGRGGMSDSEKNGTREVGVCGSYEAAKRGCLVRQAEERYG